jgi:hypothetical protein
MGGNFKYAFEMDRCHDIHSKFHKDLFSHSEVDREGYIDTYTHGDTDRMVIA